MSSVQNQKNVDPPPQLTPHYTGHLAIHVRIAISIQRGFATTTEEQCLVGPLIHSLAAFSLPLAPTSNTLIKGNSGPDSFLQATMKYVSNNPPRICGKQHSLLLAISHPLV